MPHKPVWLPGHLRDSLNLFPQSFVASRFIRSSLRHPTPSGLCHASIIILAKLHHPGHVPFTVSCPCPGSVTTETALWNPTAISSPRRKSLSPNSCEVWEHTLLGGHAAASAISLNGLDHILGQGLKSFLDFIPCPSCPSPCANLSPVLFQALPSGRALELCHRWLVSWMTPWMYVAALSPGLSLPVS